MDGGEYLFFLQFLVQQFVELGVGTQTLIVRLYDKDIKQILPLFIGGTLCFTRKTKDHN